MLMTGIDDPITMEHVKIWRMMISEKYSSSCWSMSIVQCNGLAVRHHLDFDCVNVTHCR